MGFQEGLEAGKSAGMMEGNKLGWEKGSAIGSEVTIILICEGLRERGLIRTSQNSQDMEISLHSHAARSGSSLFAGRNLACLYTDYKIVKAQLFFPHLSETMINKNWY